MITSYDFEVAAKNAVINVAYQTFGEFFNINQIQVVWLVHLLGYKKAVLIDIGKNNRVYEVTYNKDKDEMYVDTYEKFNNTVFRGSEDEIDYVAHM